MPPKTDRVQSCDIARLKKGHNWQTMVLGLFMLIPSIAITWIGYDLYTATVGAVERAIENVGWSPSSTVVYGLLALGIIGMIGAVIVIIMALLAYSRAGQEEQKVC